MPTLATRFVRTLGDLTVGTVIVLVHVALADIEKSRPAPNTAARARRGPLLASVPADPVAPVSTPQRPHGWTRPQGSAARPWSSTR
jgi:hypothetical protein